MYLLFVLPLFIYVYILCNQSITFIAKTKILLYSISMSLITYFGLKYLQSCTFVFWYNLSEQNYYLFLLFAAILEEFCKFFFIPFISKDIFTIDKMCIMTAFNFSLLETIGYFYITESYFIAIYRLIAIIPLHLFIAFLYYYLFYKFQKIKVRQLIYIIPFITAFFHSFLNYILSNVQRYIVLGISCIFIVLMIYIAKKYMFQKEKQ